MASLTKASVLIIADHESAVIELVAELESQGFVCEVDSSVDGVNDAFDQFNLQLVIADTRVCSSDILRRLKKALSVQIFAVISEDELVGIDPRIGIDDFAIKPLNPAEVAARIRLIMWRKGNISTDSLIKQGDLVMDLAKYEVAVGGKLIDLSFKEYELLKVLISNSGRVLTRQALLDKVWGHDYFGGDRTVDVHIRRLRSKIEFGDYTFIETVRGVGYKFKEL